MKNLLKIISCVSILVACQDSSSDDKEASDRGSYDNLPQEEVQVHDFRKDNSVLGVDAQLACKPGNVIAYSFEFTCRLVKDGSLLSLGPDVTVEMRTVLNRDEQTIPTEPNEDRNQWTSLVLIKEIPHFIILVLRQGSWSRAFQVEFPSSKSLEVNHRLRLGDDDSTQDFALTNSGECAGLESEQSDSQVGLEYRVPFVITGEGSISVKLEGICGLEEEDGLLVQIQGHGDNSDFSEEVAVTSGPDAFDRTVEFSGLSSGQYVLSVKPPSKTGTNLDDILIEGLSISGGGSVILAKPILKK